MNPGTRTSVSALVIALGSAPSAQGYVLDIAIADATGNHCVVVTPGMPSTLLVTATFEGILTPAVEFRVAGLPAGWLVSASPSPAVDFRLGDVFGNGVNLTLRCEPGVSSVVLYEVTVLPLDAGPVILSVMPHMFPANGVPCPKFVFGLCEAPVDGFLCLSVGPRALLGTQDDCLVATESRTWSGVKHLYQ